MGERKYIVTQEGLQVPVLTARDRITGPLFRPIGKAMLLLLADPIYLDHNQHKQETDKIRRLSDAIKVYDLVNNDFRSGNLTAQIVPESELNPKKSVDEQYFTLISYRETRKSA